MRKWIFILMALGLSPLCIATTVNTAPQSLAHNDAPTAGLTLESYFYHRYKKQPSGYDVYQPQQRCKVQVNSESRTVKCSKGIVAAQSLQQSRGTSKPAEAHPDDQVFEITLPAHQPQAGEFLGQQISQQTPRSLLQQVSPLIEITFSCLLIVMTVSLFHWREIKKSSTNKARKQ